MAVTGADGETRRDATRGIVLIVAAMIVFATHDAAIKHVAQTHPIVQIMWVRYMMFAVFALVLARQKQPLRECFRTKKLAMQSGRAVMLLLDTGFFVLAVKLLPLADAHALIAAFPLIVTALAVRAGGACRLTSLVGRTGRLRRRACYPPTRINCATTGCVCSARRGVLLRRLQCDDPQAREVRFERHLTALRGLYRSGRNLSNRTVLLGGANN